MNGDTMDEQTRTELRSTAVGWQLIAFIGFALAAVSGWVVGRDLGLWFGVGTFVSGAFVVMPTLAVSSLMAGLGGRG